ncbi:MAG TPA: GNAT family N-acetyltransferase, partial [Kouleothrix sp.]|nr:GNAT family N-acetyltransferase [Kouleothrix sp.]
MTDTSQLDYGPVRADEIDELNILLEQALTFTSGSMATWTAALGLEHIRAVRRGGRPVAGMGVIPMGHYFGGRSVPTAGITAVGVAPDQRGSGAGLWMIGQSLLEQQRQGVPLASLYPATTSFYRRSGFERAAARVLYELPLAAIGVRDYTLDAAPAGAGEHALIKQLYARQAERSAAMIDRPEFYWNGILAPKEKRAYSFLVRRDGVPEGYVVLFHTSWNEQLQVRDLVALTPAAGRRLLTLLADHRSMIETARLPGGPNDALLLLLPEQKHKVGWQLDLMLRILDVPGALEARGYPQGLAAELHLEVRDELIASNNGRFVLAVEGGRGSVRLGGQGTL